MSYKILNKNVIQHFQLNHKRVLSVQYHVNNKHRHQIINCQYKNKNHLSDLGIPKYLSQHHLCQISTQLYMTFQKRNLSNQTNVQVDSEQLLKSSLPDLPSSEIIKNIPTDNFPSFFTTISESKIVELAQTTLLKVHEVTGLPWCATIALMAFMTRTLMTFPFSLIQMHNNAKLQALKPEMDDIVKEYKRRATYAVSVQGYHESIARRQYQRDVKAEWNKLIVRDNCHPFKSFVIVLIQLPVWISFSFATRNLSYMLPAGSPTAELTYLEMMVGGFGWVKNLTDVDHYMILPLASTLINLAIIEVNMLFKEQQALTRLQKWQLYTFRGLSLLMFPIAIFIPAGTLIYWISSSLFGLLQAFLFNSTRLHRLVGTPIESYPKHPYRLLYNNLKSRLRLSSK